MIKSLWGAAFDLPDIKKTDKALLQKVETKKEVSVEKKLKKTSKLSLAERLALIEKEVNRILGVYKENTVCIRDRESLHEYINHAIENGIIAIDTETNNSLDPTTCKLMGGCIYTPGQKNAYIPINHVDEAGNKLSRQLTEKDIQEEFSRLSNTFTIWHNAKFDFSVIRCTCGIDMPIGWDTLICAKILDENEEASLKQQYISKIDPSIEKYDITHLFDIEYAYVPPELFALYAATDAYMTYKLYLWQVEQLNKPENKELYTILREVEFPVISALADMELNGMKVDLQYAQRLSNKYHKKLDDLENKINAELIHIKPIIDQWRLTPDANYHPLTTKGDKDGKSKSEQLTDPINLGSPTQMAILFYDVFKCPVVNKKKPRSTGEEDLNLIAEKLKLPICDLVLERRELIKLLTTYIDAIPTLAQKWPDGRIRSHFNQYGAKTGRLSSGGTISFGWGSKESGINF